MGRSMAMAPLIQKGRHISDAANNADPYQVIRGRVNGLKKAPDARLMSYLEQAGFGSAASIRTFDLHYDLLSALVERWRPETQTFHFPCGECTLLGDSPEDEESNFTSLKFTWLKAKFGQLSANATEGELMCAARAYIMHILGGVLMSDANNNRVHMMYLPLLADLSNVRSYSWGSAVLAMLYRELYRATNSDIVDMGGCLTLLQSWALYRMPFLASVSH
ncbi:protein MAINTENANCE OF MERISTEMS-like [Gossypium hirsutum]|uniref:Protein MAINTENANCE OF MERISTEMS-like n=1 Tax=Gossypium hirsutum TaxID=3635 RepID=A0ABM2ZXK2_GOSHI|nr:protein MAINTENANCE OF MERISTEMS-like [Gossypium hirsutum]